MPSVPTLISGGISIGIIASFISGVYYVLIAGLKWMGKLQASIQSAEEARADKWSCARCGRILSRVKTGPGRRLQCTLCSLFVCRHCCSKTSASKWICSNCWKYRDITLQTGEWFYAQLKKRFLSTVATSPGNINQDVEVRDFMERIVEDMVGGELDSVSLRPISLHPEYVKFCETYHDELALLLSKFSLSLQMAVSDKILPDSDSPSVIQEELKELIKRIINEAMMLPNLQNYSSNSVKELLNGEVNDLEKKSYEDILATAVINKVVERYQNELNNFNSHHNSRDANGNVVRRKVRRRRLTAGVGVVERSNSSDSDGSESAGYTNDDCSWSGSCKTDPLSLTIEECIEEVVTKYSSDDDANDKHSGLKHFLSGLDFKKRQRAPFPEFGMDVIDRGHSSISSDDDDNGDEAEDEDTAAVRVGVEVVSPVESWEENWLFQRRRLKTACLSQSMPVPMLVPNPSQDEPRARIGDIDIDDTSDLSDCSDSALEDIIDGKDYSEPRNSKSNVLVLNRKVSSSEESEEENEFIMSFNRSALNSLDNINVNVTGICNGNIEHGVIDNHKTTTVPAYFKSEDVSCSQPSYLSRIVEAKNNELIVPQVDSGEGSLEMQQDQEYTVEYDAPVQVQVTNDVNFDGSSSTLDKSVSNDTIPEHCLNEGSNKPIALETPIPKPRSIIQQNASNESNKDVDLLNTHKENSGNVEKENFEISIKPPRPGTIAEREILKWQKAVPLSNNPYSKENIERRQRDRLLLSRQSSTDFSVEFPELTGANDSSVVHIDCSGRKPDYKQYGRDYYINNGSHKKNDNEKQEKEKAMEDEKKRKYSSCEKLNISSTSLHSDEKPQVSVRVEVDVIDCRWQGSSSTAKNSDPPTTSSVETRTHVTDLKDEQHLTTISTSSNYNNDNEKHHKVTTISTWTNKNPKKGSKDIIPLPSVKALAKQFSTSDMAEQHSNPTPQKRLDVHVSPVKQVHSLTARCISKEFREGLRAANQPKPQSVKSTEKVENTSGNISDDSGTASPTPMSAGNQKLYNSIAFWEQMKSNRQ